MMLSGVQRCLVEFERSKKCSVDQLNISIVLGVVELC